MVKGHTPYCGLVRGPHVEKQTISGIPNRLNYCEILIIYTKFRNGPHNTAWRGGDPFRRWQMKEKYKRGAMVE
jgi:hypothetical protein